MHGYNIWYRPQPYLEGFVDFFSAPIVPGYCFQSGNSVCPFSFYNGGYRIAAAVCACVWATNCLKRRRLRLRAKCSLAWGHSLMMSALSWPKRDNITDRLRECDGDRGVKYCGKKLRTSNLNGSLSLAVASSIPMTV